MGQPPQSLSHAVYARGKVTRSWPGPLHPCRLFGRIRRDESLLPFHSVTVGIHRFWGTHRPARGSATQPSSLRCPENTCTGHPPRMREVDSSRHCLLKMTVVWEGPGRSNQQSTCQQRREMCGTSLEATARHWLLWACSSNRLKNL